jgi:ATP-dependent RNA helicase RhlB
MAESHLTDLSFTGLHLPEVLQKGLADAGFERCTPIQAQTLPHALAGLDVAGQAQTGTGKTVAFLVAMFARLLREPVPAGRKLNGPRAVILAPTRELAVQIHSDAVPLGQHTSLRLGLAFGGIDFEKQKRHLEEGVDVLIGTPGRIIDFYKQHVIDLSSVQVLVLDEADRMFDLGFIADIRYILRRMPAPDKRLNLLFSATLSQRVLELAYEHMNSPQLTRIEPDKMTVERTRQVIYYPSNNEKPRLLVGLLKSSGSTRSMVFVNTRRAAEDVEALLRDNGINAEAISGDVPQQKRLRMLRDFHEGTLAVLIGTDVASRGLHIPDVSHVFNYDLPQDPEDYVHRIGRTARAGNEGDAISLGCEEYVITLPEIEAYIGRKIPVASVTPELLVELAPASPRRRKERAPDHRRSGGGQGGRAGAGPRHHAGGGHSNRPQGGHGGRQGRQGGGQPRHRNGPPPDNREMAPADAVAAPRQQPASSPQQGRRPRRDGQHADAHRRPEARPETRQDGRHDARRGGGRHDGRRSQQRAPEQNQPRVVPQQPAPRPSVAAKVGRFVKNLFGRLGGKRR